jgi:hypothetical protein
MRDLYARGYGRQTIALGVEGMEPTVPFLPVNELFDVGLDDP